VSPEHTREARAILSGGVLLAPEQKVIVESDPVKARAIGRPVVALRAWGHIAGVRKSENPQAAVTLACKLAGIALTTQNPND